MTWNKVKKMLLSLLFDISFIPAFYLLAILFEPPHVTAHGYRTYILDPALDRIAEFLFGSADKGYNGMNHLECCVVFGMILTFVLLSCLVFQILFIVFVSKKPSRKKGGYQKEINNYKEKNSRTLMIMNIFVPFAGIGAAISGFISYRSFEQYYNSPSVHAPTKIEALYQKADIWFDTAFFGLLLGAFTVICLCFIAACMLWSVRYLFAKVK